MAKNIGWPLHRFSSQNGYLQFRFDEQVNIVPCCRIYLHYSNYLNSKISVSLSVNEVVRSKPAIFCVLGYRPISKNIPNIALHVLPITGIRKKQFFLKKLLLYFIETT